MTLSVFVLCCCACFVMLFLDFLFWDIEPDNIFLRALVKALSVFLLIASAIMVVVVIFGVFNVEIGG